jgi:protein-disulfide isomerase
MTDAPDTTPEPARAAGFFDRPRSSMAAMAVAVVALGLAAAPYVTGGNFDGRVRAYLLENPEILQEVSAALQAREDSARTEAVNQQAAANPSLLAVSADDPAFGPVDARVTVIEFFDFRCPGCKATAPDVLRLMQAHPDVRFVFKDWPILDRGTDDVSHYAARAAQAAHRQGKYLPVFQDLMAEPALSEAAIDRILEANGVSLSEAEAAMSSAELAGHMADMQTSAMALGLVGTPTFFVNGKAMESIEPAALERAIRDAKAG